MASTIIIKNGAGSSTPSSLKQGELAINVDNGKLFYGTSGSSNAVSSSFSFQHITASGDISSSGGMIMGRDMTLSTNGVGQFSVIANGVVSASGLIQGTAFKQENNGNLTFVVDTSGNVSSSGTLSGTALTLATNGETKASIDASGNISSSGGTITTSTLVGHGTDTIFASDGKISASNALIGQELTLASNGTTHSSVSTDGSASFAGGISTFYDATASLGYITASNLIIQGTDQNAGIALYDNSGNAIAQFARCGSGTNAHKGRMLLKDNATTKIELTPIGTSYVMGDFSSSALISATSLDIRTAGVQKAQIDTQGAVTASAYHGTQHILRSMAFYVNDNPLVQNSLYFGNSIGNSPNNWNDPQAAGGAITSTNSFNIAEDDMNWGHILPFDISKVEIQCSLRPGLGDGDNFTLAVYTGSRQEATGGTSVANMTLTKIGNSSGITFDAAEYVTNDLEIDYNGAKGTILFVGVGSEDATDAKNGRGMINITITQR